MNVIYQIKNKKNNKRYIGCSSRYNDRKKHHIRSLNLNTHCNFYLQKAWNKYGQDSFEFSIIETLDSPDIMFLREEELIDNEDNLYNIAKGGLGGDTFTDNPNKEQVRENMKAERRERYKDPDERKKVSPFNTGDKKRINELKKIWSEAKLGSKNNNFQYDTSVKQIDMTTNEVVKVWDYPALVNQHGFNAKYVRRCCDKKPSYKSHKGYFWEWDE